MGVHKHLPGETRRKSVLSHFKVTALSVQFKSVPLSSFFGSKVRPFFLSRGHISHSAHLLSLFPACLSLSLIWPPHSVLPSEIPYLLLLGQMCHNSLFIDLSVFYSGLVKMELWKPRVCLFES